MSFKRFTASGTSEVILDVPEGYKILCGGVTLNGYALLTASYPASATRWVCTAVPLHRDATVVVTVMALEAADGILDVEVASESSKGTAVVRCAPPGVGLCGGAKVEGTCLTVSSVLASGAWVAAAESPQDVVTAYILVGKMRDPTRKLLVDANPRGTWRIYMEGVGDAAVYLGSARCQNSVAQSTVCTPPSQYASSHPWKATPRLWRMSRSTLPSESLNQLTKSFCTVTKKSPHVTPRGHVTPDVPHIRRNTHT